MDERQKIRLLLIEDDPEDAELFLTLLRRARRGVSIEMEWADGLSSALDRLAREGFDIVVTDLGLPESRGIETFTTIHGRHPDIPVIVLTGLSDEALALSAVQKGAQDYLVKGEVGRDLLLRSIRYSIERQKLLTEFERSLKEIKTLKGLIPVCAWCRKMRDDRGYWKKVETYLEEHTDASFSHGICPECLEKTDPQMFELLRKETPEVLERGTPGSTEAWIALEEREVSVLLIEDDPGDAELIREVASEGNGLRLIIEHVTRLSAAIERLGKAKFDLVLSDLGLPDSNGIETFIKIHTLYPEMPVILLTGLRDEELGAKAVRSGAQDYAVKGQIDGKSLKRAIRYSIERQKMLSELGRQLTEIRRLERERKNILSMFAHDIKNIVVPSVGYLTRLLAGKTQNLNADLAAIRDGLTTAEHLLTNFIEFSRFETKEYEPKRIAVDMEAVVGRQLQVSKRKADEKGITVSSEFSEKPFPAVMADQAMLERVIANLLDNAVKYTDPGGAVTVRVATIDTGILVQVRDTGIGISDENIPYIFDAFFRATGAQKGSGLGLSIARTIVEAHGGELWAKSSPGEGSTFSFTLRRS